MKQRFSSLDVRVKSTPLFGEYRLNRSSSIQVIAHELSLTLCSLRLVNVYDLSPRIFLLKFAKPDHRQQLLVESGFRCHLTSFSRETAAAPSLFVSKLRKLLRTRRVTSVSQVGTDRVIELQFSDGLYRLFLEFYAGGNIVLTDKELNILTLLRVVPPGPDQEEIRIGLQYLLHNRQNYNGVPPLTKERVRAALKSRLEAVKGQAQQEKRQKKKSPADGLRKALSGSLSEFPPILIDHALRVRKFGQNASLADVLQDEELLDDLMKVLALAQEVNDRVTGSDSTKGYIVAKQRARLQATNTNNNEDDQSKGTRESHTLYEDFQPFKPEQLEDDPNVQVLEFDGFNKTVDEFFSSIEGQRLESRRMDHEESARRKLEAARQDHQNRISGLQQVQELNVRKAQAIEFNSDKVQEAITAVNSLIAQGMDWVEMARLIEMEQARNNAIASLIKLPLKLFENKVTLLLPEEAYNEEDPDEDFDSSESSSSEDGRAPDRRSSRKSKPADRSLAVDVDLALSPWSNARQHYDHKKSAAVKEQKTHEASNKALRSTEKKVNADLKKNMKQEKQALTPVRKQLWFEKFLFFISSEGFLVLGAKDAQQSDILHGRYLARGDVFIHADLQGAAVVIAKNKPGKSNEPIPPSTLSQAGSLVVATSSAWDSKAVISAWWVNPEQVSKIASTGEYLKEGDFTIDGTKNFLPPAHLLLGLGILFRISEESKSKRLKRRFGNEKATDNEANNDDVDAAHPTHEDSEENNESQEAPQIQTIQRQTDVSETSESDGSSKNPEYHDSGELQRRALHDDSNQNPDSAMDDDRFRSAETQEGSAEEASKNTVDSIEASPAGLRNVTKSPNTIHHSSSGPKIEEQDQTLDSAIQNEVTETITEESVLNFEATEVKRLPNSSRPPGRSRHNKKNKLKAKYTEQDEDDRSLALRLLGSSTAQGKTETASAKVTKEQELMAQKQRRQQQRATAAEKGKEKEALRISNLREGIESMEESEIEILKELDAFVGMPTSEDEILDILVFCAPWEVIGPRCRWKAKLQPGATKKGKAVKEVLAGWIKVIETQEKKKPRANHEDHDGVTEENVKKREVELLRGIKEQEAIGVVPVTKCRIVMGTEGAASKGKSGGGSKGKRGGKGGTK
ncbi:MAG: hypothetical protein Q9190_004877 [Brigantiaea leucoxantha]